MGKRSDFKRVERDYYRTPYSAVVPLLKHLPRRYTFIEPCAGDGLLISHLEKHNGQCVYACDLEPQKEGIVKRDVLFFDGEFPPADFFITNPPWSRNEDGTGALHDMINLFRAKAPTWLLFDADWMHTKQAKPFLKYCSAIVSVGRVSWMENGTAGMDNCAWYHFGAKETKTIFKP